MATAKAEAVVEKTESELVAEEVAKIIARNDEAAAKAEADAKKGKPPVPTAVDKEAQKEAAAASKEAFDRVMGLQKARVQGIIESRPKNIVADVHALLNMYSHMDTVKITVDDAGKVTIVI